jgi:hypothetical protein
MALFVPDSLTTAKPLCPGGVATAAQTSLNRVTSSESWIGVSDNGSSSWKKKAVRRLSSPEPPVGAVVDPAHRLRPDDGQDS